MEFGGAHVWKTSHPQAMEFFRTQNLLTGTLEFCTQSFPKRGECPKSQFCIIFQYFCHKITIINNTATNPCSHPSLAQNITNNWSAHKVVLLPKKIATHHSYMDTSCCWICCVDKLCLGPCHNMAHLIMIKY